MMLFEGITVPDDGGMTICCKMLDDRIIELKVLPTDPVPVLACLMRAVLDMPRNTFKIFFQGQELTQSLQSLEMMGMKDGDNIYLVLFK